MRKLINLSKKAGVVLILAFIAVGCGNDKSSNLEPEVPTPSSSMPNMVVNHIQGVKVTVQSDAWPADPGITTEVTPLQVTIKNNSDMPVVLSYNHFAIITPKGEYHAALPPFEINGRVDELELARTYGAFEPAFAYRNFAVAPVYGPVYSNNIGVYAAYDFYGYGYYGNYWGFWGDMDDFNEPLPTVQMLAHALPEGIIKPGGMVKGFFYFQKVDADDVNQVRFTAKLQNAKTRNIFGQITIPFRVFKTEVVAHN